MTTDSWLHGTWLHTRAHAAPRRATLGEVRVGGERVRRPRPWGAGRAWAITPPCTVVLCPYMGYPYTINENGARQNCAPTYPGCPRPLCRPWTGSVPPSRSARAENPPKSAVKRPPRPNKNPLLVRDRFAVGTAKGTCTPPGPDREALGRVVHQPHRLRRRVLVLRARAKHVIINV
jgi:hypothetical protein